MATIHITSLSRPEAVQEIPLPPLLQTPSGLALLELQGTINVPEHDGTEGEDEKVNIGRLEFPWFDPEDSENVTWMKKVYLYVGKHQRLTGEVKKLPRAIAVVRKKATSPGEDTVDESEVPEKQKMEELEILEIVKWKIMFSTRPEPMGALAG